MPQISRKIGTTSENIRVFIQDATVSTGAGLANIVASSVSFSWSRNDMSAASSGTCTTGTLGTYTVSSFVQVNSTVALGWYEFDPPNGAFLSGDMVGIHLYGAPSMAPVPILVELTKTDNQTFMSSQTISTALNSLGLVGSVNASTVTDKAGYGVSSVNTGVNVTSIVGSAAVTSAAGVFAVAWDLGRTANLTSSIALTGTSIFNVTNVSGGVVVNSGSVNASTVSDKTGYSGSVSVSSMGIGVNVTSLVGSAAVTTQAGILATVLDLGRTANPNSTVSFSSFSISSQTVTVGGVNVTSIAGSPPVTSSAGVLSVAWDLGNILNPTSTVNLSNFSISTVAGLPVAERASIADKLLGRNVAGAADGTRTVSEAFYVLRNKVDISAGIVYGTDDLTSSWAFTASTQAGNPLVSIDPA